MFTCAAAKPDEHAELAAVADVVVCGDDEVDLSEVHGVLTGRGLTRILCEGGPSLFADLAETGNVTELCLSIAPLLAGPGSGRIMAGPPGPTTRVPLDSRAARGGRRPVRPLPGRLGELNRQHRVQHRAC